MLFLASGPVKYDILQTCSSILMLRYGCAGNTV